MQKKTYSFILMFFFIIQILFGQIQVDDIPSNVRRQIIDSGVNIQDIERIIGEENLPPISIDQNRPDLNNLNRITQEEVQADLENLIEAESSLNNQVTEDVDNSESTDVDLGDTRLLDDDNLDDDNLDDENLDILSYFGYDIFMTDPDAFQLSMPSRIDPSYIIGPGDEIIVMLWGETEINTSYVVTVEGYLFIENIGQVFVNGLTLEKLEKKLFNHFKKVYSSLGSLNDANARTYFDLSLGGLTNRSIKIFVLGEVSNPGAYSVGTSTTLFSSLFYFNGPTTNGTLRDIQLIRNQKKIKSIDFYDYILNGSKKNDIKLQKNDIIFIPPRGKTVAVKGEVNRSAIFELNEKESLIDLVRIAGNLKTTAYTGIAQIDRITPFEMRSEFVADRLLVDINLSDIIFKKSSKEKFPLFDSDTLSIFKISDFKSNSISISGSVNRSGTYEFFEKMKISDLVQKAGGVTQDAFLPKVDIIRSTMLNRQQKIVINYADILSGKTDNDILLKQNDQVIFYNYSEMLENGNVIIQGHVLDPGTKPYYEGMTFYDLLFSGGGLLNKNHLKNMFMERADLVRSSNQFRTNVVINVNLDSLLQNKTKFDFPLEAGDRAIIYSNSNLFGENTDVVRLTGNVKSPGEYAWTEGMSIKDLFIIAGGFLDSSFYKAVYKERFDIVRRIDESELPVVISLNLNDVMHEKPSKHLLKKGDQIRVYSTDIISFSNSISIEGDVRNPGVFQLKKNMTVLDLILESGGINTDVYKYRIDISRIDKKNQDEEIYSSNYTFDVLNENIKDGVNNLSKGLAFKLLSGDLVIVRPNPLTFYQRKVTILGQVYYPGDYVLISPKETIYDIIQRAGGIKKEGYPMASSLKRDGSLINISFKKLIKYPNSKENFNVIPGDTLNVSTKPNMVVIEGEVQNPGNYQYFEGKRLSDYIKLAGGLSQDASRLSTIVIYPNDQTRSISLFKFSPRVYDGSTIRVGRKEDVVPFNFTEYVSTITEIYADLLQAYLLLNLASQNSNTN